MRRIALYSHDTLGLGHLRRNLLIAHQFTLSTTPTASLLISGTSRANSFELSPGVDCLTLPSLRKNAEGGYDARQLNIGSSSLISFRSKMIRAAVCEFDPDVLIVDKVPRGALGELDATLRFLRAAGRTRCVLGLRDVLDDPATVQSEWHSDANEDTIEKFYDAIWVYGDPNVYDVATECGFSAATIDKIHYTGYLNPDLRLLASSSEGFDIASLPGRSGRRLAICMVGGGEDGARLATTFAQAKLPVDMEGVILTGPFMPADLVNSLHRAARNHPRLRVLRFVSDPDLLVRCADRVISMAGYNTTCEIVCYRKRALVVPRIRPRREQWIRASRLQAFGLLDMLHPDRLTPSRLTDWLGCEKQLPLPESIPIDFNGLARLEGLLESLCSFQATDPHRPNALACRTAM